MKSILVLSLVVLMLELSLQESFTSTQNLVALINRESEILNCYEKYIKNEENRLLKIKKAIRRLRSNSTRQTLAVGKPETYVGHPINAFRLIDFWFDIRKMAENTDNIEKLHKDAESIGIDLPNATDHNGAIDGIIRLQNTYLIETESMADGVIEGHEADPLKPGVMVEIGKKAFQSGEFGLAVQWLEAAVDRGYKNTNELPNVYAHMAEAYYEINRPNQAMDTVKLGLEIKPDDATLKKIKEKISNSYLDEDEDIGTWRKPEEYAWQEDYKSLCRGDNDVTKTTAWKDLYCWNRKTNVPFLPAKEEIYHLNPRVSLFHDVISDAQAARIRLAAGPYLHRARIGGQKYDGRASYKRIAKISWLYDSNKHVKVVSKNVARETGLRVLDTVPGLTDSAEPLQVGNYGVGGQYEPHTDYFPNENDGRLATFMLYLGQVSAGGATVFPRINVRVPPIKNGAAFWYNEKRSGQWDKQTEHAGCPVLVGSKWIGNKWIKHRYNWVRRPCGKSYWEKDNLKDQTNLRSKYFGS